MPSALYVPGTKVIVGGAGGGVTFTTTPDASGFPLSRTGIVMVMSQESNVPSPFLVGTLYTRICLPVAITLERSKYAVGVAARAIVESKVPRTQGRTSFVVRRLCILSSLLCVSNVRGKRPDEVLSRLPSFFVGCSAPYPQRALAASCKVVQREKFCAFLARPIIFFFCAGAPPVLEYPCCVLGHGWCPGAQSFSGTGFSVRTLWAGDNVWHGVRLALVSCGFMFGPNH